MTAAEAATVPPATAAPVTSATATAVCKRADSHSAGDSGSRSQDDHGLA
jgi:hypothetical protein